MGGLEAPHLHLAGKRGRGRPAPPGATTNSVNAHRPYPRRGETPPEVASGVAPIPHATGGDKFASQADYATPQRDGQSPSHTGNGDTVVFKVKSTRGHSEPNNKKPEGTVSVQSPEEKTQDGTDGPNPHTPADGFWQTPSFRTNTMQGVCTEICCASCSVAPTSTRHINTR